MEYASGLHFAGAVLEISVIDLMLSADNALIIAMCCSSLPPQHVRAAVVLGTAGAIVLRGLLTMIAGLLLQIPFLKIVAAAALAAIAIKLIVANDRSDRPDRGGGKVRRQWPRRRARARRGDRGVERHRHFHRRRRVHESRQHRGFGGDCAGQRLAANLRPSAQAFRCSSLAGFWSSDLLKRHPILVKAGGVVLGWIAGEMVVADPAIAAWAERDAPALAVVLPALGVILVLWESRILRSALRRDADVARAAPAAASASPYPAHAASTGNRQAATERTE